MTKNDEKKRNREQMAFRCAMLVSTATTGQGNEQLKARNEERKRHYKNHPVPLHPQPGGGRSCRLHSPEEKGWPNLKVLNRT